MIFNSDFNVISDLIIKDLLGSISSLERCRLNCLIDKYGLSGRSCLDKKLIFEKTLSSFDDNIYSIETKLAYRKFKTLKKKNNSNTQFFKYCSVAASVLLILSLFLFAKQILCPRSVNLDQGSIVKNHYFNNLITPNDNTPIIVLSSGLRIPINDENLEIRESGGTVLNISKRELCYTDDPLGFKFPRSINNLWNTLYVPSGSDYNVILADGSEIKVNSKSSIRFKINDTQDDRVVYLSGEAYFKVENIDNKPFVVRTSKGDIRVLGTEFNVRNYDDEKAVITTLEKGMIKYNPKDVRKPSIIILPGIQVIDDDYSNELRIELVNTYLYTSWKDGKYIFEDTSLEEIMKVLEKWYDVKFIYDSKEIKKIHYTGVLKKYENINSMLDFLETSEEISFQIFGETIIIKNK